jgi:hypothetical protein
MKRMMISAGAIVLLSVTSVWAADVAGRWTAKVPGAQGQGESDITFVFKVADDKVTGTLNNSQAPGDVEITDGKITGDDLSFSLKRNIGGNEMTVLWKGRISGDEIKFSRTLQGGGPGGGAATEITAKRAK